MIRERIAEITRPARDFDKPVRTALGFLANPWNLWRSERLEDRRAALKIAFARRLRYRRGGGFRTADLSLPFRRIDQFSGDDLKMARSDEVGSNLFETLEDWNKQLKQAKKEHGGLHL